MENFENKTPENESEIVSDTEPKPQPDAAEETEVPKAQDTSGRKESPFADSPYVMNRSKTEYTPGYTMPREPAEKPSPKTGGKVWKRALAAALALVLVITGCAITAASVNDYWEDRVASLENDMNTKLLEMESQFRDRINRIENDGTSTSGTATADGLTPGQVYAMNERSVVLVYSEVNKGLQRGYSSGSGFVLTEDGYIVTNAHVVEGGTSFLVVTSDNVEHEAELVGADTTNDLAVLKIEAENLDAVTLGSSDALVVGDQVAAIGNPLGELTSTLTVGYVSAKERYISTESSTSINMMQTDCAINSGNSGGPLFNMKGEVVGITTAKYSGTSTSGASIEGIGFAIPIDDVVGLISDLVEFGYVRSAYLGVMVTTQEEPNGVYVQSVEEGWCAAKAGLQAGDIIVKIGEFDTPTMTRLTRAMRTYNPGDTVEMVILRGGKELTLTITFDEKPNASATQNPAEQVPLPEEGNYDEWYEYFRWFFDNQRKP